MRSTMSMAGRSCAASALAPRRWAPVPGVAAADRWPRVVRRAEPARRVEGVAGVGVPAVGIHCAGRVPVPGGEGEVRGMRFGARRHRALPHVGRTQGEPDGIAAVTAARARGGHGPRVWPAAPGAHAGVGEPGETGPVGSRGDWPAELPPPTAPGWGEPAVRWLLDRVPGEHRGYEVLRRHPVALARLAVEQVEAELAAGRAGAATVRRDLAGVLPAQAVEDLLGVYEREQLRLSALLRSVRAVDDAFRRAAGARASRGSSR